jgi:hypothetical protein
MILFSAVPPFYDLTMQRCCAGLVRCVNFK